MVTCKTLRLHQTACDATGSVRVGGVWGGWWAAVGWVRIWICQDGCQVPTHSHMCPPLFLARPPAQARTLSACARAHQLKWVAGWMSAFLGERGGCKCKKCKKNDFIKFINQLINYSFKIAMTVIQFQEEKVGST